MNKNEFYHVYNRGNNKERIFFSARNYQHFLKLFEKYLGDYVIIICYCLMPNHFHFFIRIRDLSNFESDELKRLLSSKFRIFFMTYSKGINKETGRTGSLFQKNFKKIVVDNEAYFTSLIAYIHLNPVKAGLTTKCEQWKYSSYEELLSLKETRLARHDLLDWFGGRREFIRYHDECLELNLPSR